MGNLRKTFYEAVRLRHYTKSETDDLVLSKLEESIDNEILAEFQRVKVTVELDEDVNVSIFEPDGITVYIYENNNNTPITSQNIDENREVVLNNIPNGNYRISVSALGDSASWSGGDEFIVNDTHRRFTVLLMRGQEI